MFKKIRSRLKYLDPFTYVDWFLDKYNPFPQKTLKHELIDWFTYIVSGFLFAFIFYTFLGFLLSTPSPLVVVVSGSMEPTFYRGDVMLLQGVKGSQINAKEIVLTSSSLKNTLFSKVARVNYKQGRAESILFLQTNQIIPITQKGDVIVYPSNVLTNFPIIHRVVAKIKAKDGYYFLTKGDNLITNNKLDQDCSQGNCVYKGFVKEHEIVGKRIFKIPLIGYVKLIIFGE